MLLYKRLKGVIEQKRLTWVEKTKSRVEEGVWKTIHNTKTFQIKGIWKPSTVQVL